MPKRQADTKDIGYLYDADLINFARNNVQFRHLINRGRTAIVDLAAFRAAGSPRNVRARWVQRVLEFQLTSSLSLSFSLSLTSWCGARPVFRPMRQTRCPTRANESSVYLQDKDSLYTEELQMDDVENCFSRLLSQKAFEISFSSALRYAPCNDINLYTLVFVCRKHFSVS